MVRHRLRLRVALAIVSTIASTAVCDRLVVELWHRVIDRCPHLAPGQRDELAYVIEEVLAGVAGVREVAVVGRPDPEWGEAVTAVLVPADPGNLPNLESLREAVREVFPAYAAPRRLEIVDHLPRTSLGKIRRAQL